MWYLALTLISLKHEPRLGVEKGQKVCDRERKETQGRRREMVREEEKI